MEEVFVLQDDLNVIYVFLPNYASIDAMNLIRKFKITACVF